MDTRHRFLSWFLGPRAENADVFEEALLLILRDYVHWRRNYFPADPILVGQQLRREWEPEQDALSERLHRLLADLRRNFPFYSPRYIGHQLSDTLMPCTLGYIAGMLFNPNNVTPEAAPVTTHLEVEACNAVLKMLGIRQPPDLPPASIDPDEYYAHHSRTPFGWAHLTAGGTTANIEALWVARQTRAFPLAAKAVAKDRGLRINVQLPDGTRRDLRQVSGRSLLRLKPNEAIYLLPRLVEAVRRQENLEASKSMKATEVTWKALGASGVSSGSGLAKVFRDSQPVIIVAGTAHYSIAKAADVLGIGHRNIVHADIDKRFRLDLTSLSEVVDRVLARGDFPLAVVASMGTTEEGAVDPLHKILDYRERLEQKANCSFWIHADAAWGGFIRSVFCLEAPLEHRLSRKKVAAAMGFVDHDDGHQWHEELVRTVNDRLKQATARSGEPAGALASTVGARLDDMKGHVAGQDQQYSHGLRKLHELFARASREADFPESGSVTLRDTLAAVGRFVSMDVELPARGGRGKKLHLRWPQQEVCAAFMADGFQQLRTPAA